jgi:NADP-dependent 3-hydroxy acid dehydrogenase YdfG
MSALHDKVVVVTGGSSSGVRERAAALSFAREGANVFITARRAEPLEAAAADHSNIVGLVLKRQAVRHRAEARQCAARARQARVDSEA